MQESKFNVVDIVLELMDEGKSLDEIIAITNLDKHYLKSLLSKIKSSILSEYNYTNVVKLDINTSYLDRKYSYTLLPVYTIEYEYKKKKVINIMNGQTGRIGKGLPVSPLKVSSVCGVSSTTSS